MGGMQLLIFLSLAEVSEFFAPAVVYWTSAKRQPGRSFLNSGTSQGLCLLPVTQECRALAC